MKKLKLAVIGQGRSGRDIHGRFYRSQENVYFDVAAVVEATQTARAFRIPRLRGVCRLSRAV